MTIYDMACMTSNTTGTGNSITLVAAVSGFQTFLAAGIANTQVISYGITDTANTWEVGSNATFISNSTGQFLIFSGTTRTPAYSSNSGGPINLSGNSIVYQTMLQNDYDTFTPGNTITIGNTTANLFANSTEILIGNSSVNTEIAATLVLMQNSSFFTLTTAGYYEVSSQLGTSTLVANLTTIHISDPNFQSYITTSSFIAGNSTANLLANSTEIILANSTSNLILNPISFFVGNTTANAFGNSIIEIIANSTAQTVITPTNFSTGNSTSLTTVTPGGLILSGASSNTSFTLGTSVIAANGYTWLPNGLLLQWGNIASNNTGQIVTFKVPFPIACFGVTTGANTIAPTKVLGVTLVNATAFTISTANGAATLAYWTALGH